MGVLRADIVAGLGGANAINGSVHFNGSYLDIADADTAFGTGGDWTMECWINPQEIALKAITDPRTGGSTVHPLLWISGGNGGKTVGVLYYYTAGADRIVGTTVLQSGTWYHVAVVRNSGTTHLYVNGTSEGSFSDSLDYASTPTFRIGARYSSTPYNYNGYISNFRLINGTAVYTANFTPPAQRLENISGTEILCCQSPGNVEQEATGKTITAPVPANGAAAQASHFAPDKGEDHGTTFADNTKFDTLTYMVPPGGTTAESNRGRAVMMGGMIYPTASGNVIEYLQIQSGGMTKDFGDLPTARGTGGPVSSSTRGVICGGLDGPTRKNEIEYITIATTSNALDFGNLSEPLGYIGGLSNQTRGVVAGGNGPSSPNGTNKIEYITIASIGNATDFGDLVTAGADRVGAASPTRVIFFGGKINPGSWTQTDEIDYITIATTGNATDFGNTSVTRSTGGACSSSTRAVYGGGYKNTPSPQTEVNTIDYIEIATTGNAVNFGDLTVVGGYLGSTSNGTRGIFTGRMDVGPAGGNTTIDSVTIASLGDAVDWGEMTGSSVRRSAATVSDSHGGIS